jgi:hypothetical protein
LDAFFLGHHGEDGFHERGLSRCAGALDDDAKGFLELARGGGEVADEFVGVLAD